MKKLDTSSISASVGFPVKSGTLEHIQSAYQEALAQSIIAQIGSGYDSSKCYILNGLINSGTAPVYNITAGAVFFGGEVYLVDTVSGSLTGSNIVTGVIDTSFFAAANADPVTFTDGVIRNVHQIRKVVLQPGLAGSGIADYNNFRVINPSTNIGVGEMKMYVGSTSDFDISGLGIAGNVRGWAICNGSNGTYDMRGKGPMGYNSADANFDAVGTKTGGASTTTIGMANLPAQGVGFRDWYLPGSPGDLPGATDFDPLPSGFNNNLGVAGHDTDNSIVLARDKTTDNLGSGTAINNLQPYRVVLFIQRVY